MATVVSDSELNNWLASQPANTPDTPYEITVTGFRGGYSGTSQSLRANPNKYVDLSTTIVNDLISGYQIFYQCTSLVYPPQLLSSGGSWKQSFYGCSNLKQAPVIPNGVTSIEQGFYNCRILQEVPELPDSIESMKDAFYNCNLLETIPNFPNSVTDMGGCFQYCNSLKNIPDLPDYCNLRVAFYGCSSLEYVPNIPEHPVDLISTFQNCTALKKVGVCYLQNIFNGNITEDMFKGCSNLSYIGIIDEDCPVPQKTDDWHIYRLNFDSNSVQGKVFDKDGTTHTIAQTSITKSDITLPILTDELWFPTGYTDVEIEAIIQKMITYKYGVFNKDTIPPDKKSFVLQAQDPTQLITNLPFVKTSDIVDSVTSGNMHSVTSNAVREALNNYTTIGKGNGSTPTEALQRAGVLDGWIIQSFEYLNNAINAYNSGIHTISAGGPAYGFLLWKYSNIYYETELFSYGDIGRIYMFRQNANFVVSWYY